MNHSQVHVSAAISAAPAKRPASNQTRIVLVHPKGAVLPPDMHIPHIKAVNFIDRLFDGRDEPLCLMELSSREAEMATQYADVIAIDFMVLTGLPNAQYDTVWNMYTQTMERISLDTLPAFVQQITDIVQGAARTAELSDDDLGTLE